MVMEYKDADAIIVIDGRKYALYKKGPANQYPYMIDTATGEIPKGKQRSLLKSYLLQNGFDIEPWTAQLTHWWIREAIKVAQSKSETSQTDSPVWSHSMPGTTSARPSSPKDYLPITPGNITDVHQQALADIRYGGNFTMIHDVLTRFPYNTERELVAMKVSLIDLTNSTNISRHIKKISLSELVEVILSIQDFDSRLVQGDPELVSQLAKCNGRVNLFSFASKYCAYHSADAFGKDDYSICDSVVRKALPYYIPELTRSLTEKWKATYNYNAFNSCIANLLDRHDIHIPFRRRKFDHFLWYANRKK